MASARRLDVRRIGSAWTCRASNSTCFAGASAVDPRGGPRLKIVAEMHPQQWPDHGVDPREAADRFAELGLRVEALEEGARYSSRMHT